MFFILIMIKTIQVYEYVIKWIGKRFILIGKLNLNKIEVLKQMHISGGFTGKKKLSWRILQLLGMSLSWNVLASCMRSENPVCWGSGDSLNPNSHTAAIGADRAAAVVGSVKM